MLLTGESRWHLNEKFDLEQSIRGIHVKQEEGGQLLICIALNILDRTSSFNCSDSKSTSIRKASDHSGLCPELSNGYCLEERGWVVEIDDVETLLSCCNDKELLLYIHGVDFILAGNRSDGCWSPQIPVLDSLIP
jgi:hypothetical protein